MSSQDVTTLIDMGFQRNKAEKALEVTGNQGVEPAMEWLLAHADDPVPTAEPPPTLTLPTLTLPPSDTVPPPHTSAGNGDLAMETDQDKLDAEAAADGAKSLKCDECGRLFKTQLEIEFHAAKSGHSSFSESTEEKKPLTEEEKKEQLRLIEEKMKQKRVEREEKEKREAHEKEKLRIRSGKEMVAAKKKLEEDEMKKLVDLRKREKLEEKMARQRVKDQIEQDKIARRAKFGMAAPAATETIPPPAPEQRPQVQHAVPKDYLETKLQIRLTNGQALTQTFGCKEQLSAVRLYVEMNRTDGSGPFSLMTNFPKKIFTDDDYEKPLDFLGLVPAAVVIVSRTATQLPQ